VTEPIGEEDVGRSLIRQFRSRSAVYLSAEVLVKLLAVGLFLTTVQAFGPELFGRVSRVAALIGVAASVGDFGLSMLLLRRVGGLGGATVSPAEQRRILVLRTAITAVAVLACIAYLAAAGATQDALVAAAGGGAGVLIRGFPDLVGSVLRGRGRTGPDFVVRVVSGVAFVVVGVIVVKQGFGVAGFGAAWLAGALVAAVAAGIASIRMPKSEGPVAPAWDVREILRGALPYAVLNICIIVYFRIDTEMVARICGDVDAGIYGTAYRMFEVCLLLPGAASAALIPLFAGAFERERTDEVRRLVADGCRVMAFIGGLGAVVGYSAGPLAIDLLLRKDVGDAAGVFRVLVWTVPVIFMSCVTASLIAASRRPQVNIRIAVVMVVENVTLNLFAIPRWGPAGAAAATVATEATGLVIATFVVRSTIGGFAFGSTLARLTAGVVAGVAATFACPGWAAPVAGGAAFAGAWYLGSVAGPRPRTVAA
jgi:O-antigen/teichoic acid export membrane protein